MYILIDWFMQTGESTPGITGYFEVTVAGTLIHSKKVCESEVRERVSNFVALKAPTIALVSRMYIVVRVL